VNSPCKIRSILIVTRSDQLSLVVKGPLFRGQVNSYCNRVKVDPWVGREGRYTNSDHGEGGAGRSKDGLSFGNIVFYWSPPFFLTLPPFTLPPPPQIEHSYPPPPRLNAHTPSPLPPTSSVSQRAEKVYQNPCHRYDPVSPSPFRFPKPNFQNRIYIKTSILIRKRERERAFNRVNCRYYNIFGTGS
jgi:hypothetical protein